MRTRLALVLETSGGGSGRHVIDLASSLSRRNFEITVIYSPRRAIGSFIEALEAIPNLRLAPLDMVRSVGVRDFRCLLALAALLKRLGPFDITHAHSSKAGALVRLLPSNITGKKLYTPHCFITMDPMLGKISRRLYSRIERTLGRLGDGVVAVSQCEVEHALSLGIDKRCIAKVVNGTVLPDQLGRAAARRSMSVSTSDVVFGFVGRLDSQKDPIKFVDAINRAREIIPAIRGVVFGDGPLRDQLARRSTPGPCCFMGWCRATAYMPGIDVFVLTSRYEAMPYTLIEALHSGLPIIATDVGGVAEAVESGRNGIVVDRDSSAAEIADQMARIAADAKLLREWSAESRNRSTAFTVERMVSQTEDLYMRLLDGTR